MPDTTNTGPWEYSDEQAQLVKRVAALEQELAAFKAAVAVMASYLGVTHLLAPR